MDEEEAADQAVERQEVLSGPAHRFIVSPQVAEVVWAEVKGRMKRGCKLD